MDIVKITGRGVIALAIIGIIITVGIMIQEVQGQETKSLSKPVIPTCCDLKPLEIKQEEVIIERINYTEGMRE